MSYDVFISYSWTERTTKVFVHDLATRLQTIGFNVGIDINVDYGNSLTGFMNSICDANHVLMIADASYVERANSVPESGVAAENKWISKAINAKPNSWLGVIFVDQRKLPSWLESRNPKGFSFNLEGEMKYGSEQIDDLWRWLTGLPANKKNAISPSIIRKRLARVERISNMRDPSVWTNPEVEGTIRFEFEKAPRNCFNIEQGIYSFTLMCTKMSSIAVYLYSDYVNSIGLLSDEVDISQINADQAAGYLVPNRNLPLNEKSKFVIMNKKTAPYSSGKQRLSSVILGPATTKAALSNSRIGSLSKRIKRLRQCNVPAKPQ